MLRLRTCWFVCCVTPLAMPHYVLLVLIDFVNWDTFIIHSAVGSFSCYTQISFWEIKDARRPLQFCSVEVTSWQKQVAQWQDMVCVGHGGCHQHAWGPRIDADCQMPSRNTTSVLGSHLVVIPHITGRTVCRSDVYLPSCSTKQEHADSFHILPDAIVAL